MRKNPNTIKPYLVLAGMHGPPEVTGLALRQRLLARALDEWDVEVANEEAVAAGLRFIKYNLATSIGKADPNSPDYELRRADELKTMARKRKRTLDIHDLPVDRRGDLVVLGYNSSPELLRIAGFLGMKNVIIYKDGKNLSEYDPNTLVVEMGRGRKNELVDTNVDRLIDCMNAIASDRLSPVNTDTFNYYHYATEIPTARAQELDLDALGELNPFDTIPNHTLALLAKEIPNWQEGEYVTDYWNGYSSSPDWFGGVLRRVDNPFPAAA